jgi:large subunit ribosomal protein L29
VKTAELRERTSDELRNMEKDMVRELWQSRFDNHTNKLDETSKIKKLRRGIAQVKTILTERERAEKQG